MFSSLQDKISAALKSIRGRGSLTPKDIEETLRQVRLALLEADVNFKVAKEFCDKVIAKASGQDVLKSLTPDQQVIKIVHEELVAMLGSTAAALNLSVAPPAIIMLVGLQGSGKTTTAGKLARFVREELRRRPLLAPADVYRPAAIDQLKTLGRALDVPVFDSTTAMKPLAIAQGAVQYAQQHALDTVILDTAGRLQIDRALMDELGEIVDVVKPHEILLVVDAMTGQEAVNVAKTFDAELDLNGLVLTKLDGDARGGAALSMRAVTGKPIIFVGMGEKSEALEPFHPERMASRILGMGDVLSLIEKAQKNISVDESLALHEKIKKNQFSLEDFLQQLRMVKRMGSITSLASMIPGMDKMMKAVDPAAAEKELKQVEAMVLSMTREERRNHEIINGSRRKRIAKGSGTSVEQLNRFLKQYVEMRKMMEMMSKGGLGSLLGKAGLGGMFPRR